MLDRFYKPEGDTRWKERAACKDSDADFFPITEADEGPAKAVCGGCPVKGICRDFATERREKGIWGGMNERERDAYRRKLRAERRRNRGEAGPTCARCGGGKGMYVCDGCQRARRAAYNREWMERKRTAKAG